VAVETGSSRFQTEFPAQLDSQLEMRGAQESFSWGPQTLWFLSGLVELFLYVARDVKEYNRQITATIAAAAALLAILAWRYAARRQRRHIVLLPVSGWVGLYQGGVFQYSFSPSAMVRNRISKIYAFHMLFSMFLLVVIAFVLAWDSLRGNPIKGHLPEVAFSLYPLAFALFAFVAVLRSHFRMVWYWIPNGRGKTDKAIGFSRAENRKLTLDD
jgi:hypothetical protein